MTAQTRSLIIFVTLLTALPIFSVAGESEPVCLIKPDVTLRKGPGAEFSSTWVAPKYMPFLKIDQKGPWIKIRDLDGDIHWVHGSSISRKATCAVVKTKIARLRKGPGKDQPLADLQSVDKYTAFKKIDRDGEWVQVRDEYKGTYWVHENNIWIPMAKAKVVF